MAQQTESMKTRKGLLWEGILSDLPLVTGKQKT
jgi:hypothetical protein